MPKVYQKYFIHIEKQEDIESIIDRALELYFNNNEA